MNPSGAETHRMTKLQTRVLEALQASAEPLSPTQIGVGLGYSHTSASSRVAEPLRSLVSIGKITKHVFGHNKVVYSVK
jgi:Fe2+ or Zn2+ uptake regulation protein